MMSKPLSKLLMNLGKTVVVFGFIITTFTVSPAQDAPPQKRPQIRIQIPNPDPADDARRGGKDEPLSIETELTVNRAIKEADRQYQENLNRAHDLSSLGLSIAASFKQKQTLDREDIKKLEKFEKLAKGIRNAAGGSDDKVAIEKPPKDLAAAMEMLSDLSQSLKEKVEKTPKRVISAAVIDEANVLLELIRIVRSTLPTKV